MYFHEAYGNLHLKHFSYSVLWSSFELYFKMAVGLLVWYGGLERNLQLILFAFTHVLIYNFIHFSCQIA